jgi:hypothetical protein
MEKQLELDQKKEIKEKINSFMNFWKEENYSSAYSRTALTFRSRHDVNDLKTIIGFKVNTSIPQGIFFITPCVADCHVLVTTHASKFKLRIRLMKELAPFVPSEAGEWLISPQSIKRIKS